MKALIPNRFGFTGWLFLSGLAISAFLLMNISDVVSRIRREEAGINKFAHSEIYWVTPIDNENFYLRAPELAPKVISATQAANCNISFYDLSVHAEHQIHYSFVELVMNSPCDQKLVSHTKKPINTNFPKDSNMIVIGESVIAITENRDGKLLNLSQIIVPVADVLEDYSPSKIDNSIYAFWHCADDAFREYLTSRITKRLSESTLQVHFYSDDPIDEDIQRFSDAMTALGLNCRPTGTYLDSGYKGKDAQNLWYRAYNKLLLPICVLFAAFTCFTTSYLWLSSRTKELSIRKAYGYTNAQILAFVIKDELLLAIPSISVALIVHLLFCMLTGSFDYFDAWFIPKLAFVCAGMLLIAMLCALRQVRHISRISPADAVKED